MRTRIRTMEYAIHHGAEPRGDGPWMFRLEAGNVVLGDVCTPWMSWTGAKVFVRAYVREMAELDAMPPGVRVVDAVALP